MTSVCRTSAGPQVPAHGALKLSLPKNGVGTASKTFVSSEKRWSAPHAYFESSTEGSQELPPLPSEDHLWLWAEAETRLLAAHTI